MVQATRRDTSHGAGPPEQSSAPSLPDDTPHGRRAKAIWYLASLASAAVVVGVHLWLAEPRKGPRILADEIGYLANARFLAGGGTIDMSHTAFYAGGYSLVLVPLSKLLAVHPARLYASVVGYQALHAGASVLLIAQLCRWLLGTSRGWSLVVAVAAGCYPTFVADTGFAWAESTLTFVLLVVITAAMAILRGIERDAPRSRLIAPAVLLGVACGALVTMHNRTLLASLAVVVIVAVVLLRSGQMTAAGVLVGTAGVTTLAGERFNAYLRSALWNGHGAIDAQARLSTLRHWRRFLAGMLRLDGQTWYQTVATAGIVVVAVVALVLVVLRPSRRGNKTDKPAFAADARRGGALVVLCVFFGLLFVSAVYLASGNRADHIVYGRYVDIATPLLIALGLAWLGTAPARRDLAVAALAMVVTTVGLWWVLDKTGRTELARPFNTVTTFSIAGWLDYPRYDPALFRATAWALGFGLAAIAIAFIARRSRSAAWVPTAVATTGVVAVFVWQLGFVHAKVVDPLGAGTADTRALVGAVAGSHVDELRLDPTIKVVGRLLLQYWLPRVDIVSATPANERCSRGLTVSRSSEPNAGEEYVQSVGPYSLFRGTVECPA